MHGYYGGLASVLIRHTSIPVVYCDFTSQYPTVNALLGIWPLLVAQDLRVQNVTKKMRNLLANLTVEQLLDPDIWLRLGFFALIEPHGDILPVRTCYSETGETNIGRNPLTSKEPIWYAGPDLAAAVLLTGRSPKIIRAIRLVPVGIQNGLVPTVLGDRTIDPSRDNFFTAVIENRKQLSSEHPMYYFLKILANAGGYGMYADHRALLPAARVTQTENSRERSAYSIPSGFRRSRPHPPGETRHFCAANRVYCLVNGVN